VEILSLARISVVQECRHIYVMLFIDFFFASKSVQAIAAVHSLRTVQKNFSGQQGSVSGL
jgi:hypothetical protein